jgi:hypothetical protein
LVICENHLKIGSELGGIRPKTAIKCGTQFGVVSTNGDVFSDPLREVGSGRNHRGKESTNELVEQHQPPRDIRTCDGGLPLSAILSTDFGALKKKCSIV